ncbi:MAG: caspase family protein [Bacteroidetes bacterium]|nr:caspase family protein [Bacteroidota bacterium]
MNRRAVFGFLLLLMGFSVFAGSEPTGAAIRGKHALLIGAGDYTHWNKISSVRDVDSIHAALLRRGFQEKDIVVLTDAQVVKDKVNEALIDLAMRIRAGDVVHIHFSGHGIQVEDDNGDELDRYDEALIMIDAPRNLSTMDSEKHIFRDDELGMHIKRLSEKLTGSGQLVISLDAAHSGPDEGQSLERTSLQMVSRGGMKEDFNLSDDPNSPLILFAPCLNNELAYEYKEMGAWSYAFVNALKDSSVKRYIDLQLKMQSILDTIAKNTTPTASGNLGQFIYRPISTPDYDRISSRSSNNKKTRHQGNFYVLTIGVDAYNIEGISSESFSNCIPDAFRFQRLMQAQFTEFVDTSKYSFNAFRLLREKATLNNINEAINTIINQAGKDDYFFFNFAGYTARYIDSSGREDIYFIPYSTKSIQRSDDVSLLKVLPPESISLSRLKDLLVFIPCQNQLIVSEAGSSARFAQMLTKALIETSPSIMELEKRNRVILVPRKYGMNSTECNGSVIQAGPINHFLSELVDKNRCLLDAFDESKDVRNAFAYDLLRVEGGCGYQSGYFQLFFERDILEDLQFYLEDAAVMRGGKSSSRLAVSGARKLGRKYALVIATNNYKKGYPSWQNLTNPVTDGSEIGRLLKEKFGYEVTVLTDPDANQIIRELDTLSKRLKEDDQFICFIAGHGDYDPDLFDDGFLVLSESLPFEKDPYRRTYLPFTQLGNIIDNLPARQSMLLVDICFGGAFDQKLSQGQMRSRQGVYADMDVQDMVKSKIDKQTRIVLSSGSLNEVPDGYQGKHSPFAARIISALNSGGGEKGVILSSQLYELVKWLPSKPFLGELRSNEPGSEFFLMAE